MVYVVLGLEVVELEVVGRGVQSKGAGSGMENRYGPASRT